MLKSIQALKIKFFTKESVNTAIIERNHMRSTIENLCKEHLLDFEDELLFEVAPNIVSDIQSILTEKAMLDKYEFSQMSETLYTVRYKDIDML